jgi:hypothetical protein
MASYDLGVVKKMSVSCVVGCKTMFMPWVALYIKPGQRALYLKEL